MVELLVSIAVIALIVTMINRLVGSISQAVTTNTKQLDAAAQARLVFDRLGMDLLARPRRTDLGVAFTKGGNNDSDSIAFYSTVTGYNLVGSGSNGTRDLSVVSYRIQNSAERVYQLERGASAPDYTAGTGPFQTPAQPPTLPQ